MLTGGYYDVIISSTFANKDHRHFTPLYPTCLKGVESVFDEKKRGDLNCALWSVKHGRLMGNAFFNVKTNTIVVNMNEF